MPVYEFYCVDCHAIFNFLSRRFNVVRRPRCPKCGRPDLERQVSFFAYSKGRKEEESSNRLENLDGEKMEKAIAALAGEMTGVDENDPRQMAKMMRKLSETTGLRFGSHVDEALQRLEGGEDPEKIEEEMGELFDREDSFTTRVIKDLTRRNYSPAHDDKLYTLDDTAE